jgi:hypothetical protein
MTKFFVLRGIMEGTIFNGEPLEINGERRIWNTETAGQSYPAVDCVEVMETEEVAG